jgi:hypothetical protein
MPFMSRSMHDGPSDAPRWLPARQKRRCAASSLFDDDTEEVYCEFVGTGKWLANIAPRKKAPSRREHAHWLS